MLKIDKKRLETIVGNGLSNQLFKGKFGLEKENVRVTVDGELALTSHPSTFGNKIENPYITTDFSESQVEMITPPMESVEDAYNMLETLHNIVSLNIGEELLWPQSTPPILPNVDMIPIANYDSSVEGKERFEYRKELAEKHGKKKQLLSGIHYNFSFDEKFIFNLHKAEESRKSIKDYKNELYLRIVRHTLKYSWLLIRLLGSSPAIHESYSDYCDNCNNVVSVRNGSCGYNNSKDLYVPLDSIRNYVSGIHKLIDNGSILDAKEYYSIIRPKNRSGNHDLLFKTGIDYLELRLVDVNPLFKLGISKDDLHLIHLFILLMVIVEDEVFDEETYIQAMKNNRSVADDIHDTSILKIDNQFYNTKVTGNTILNKVKVIAELSDSYNEKYENVVNDSISRSEDVNKLYSTVIYNEIKDKGFIDYHIDRAKEYLLDSKMQRFNFIGYEDMELSTQILVLDAIRQGIKVDILDKHENFIRLSSNGKSEVVKQATKTSLDNYSTVLAMENKAVTKMILDKAHIHIPLGEIYDNHKTALSDYETFKEKEIVIKPNNTNFGLGITIFKTKFSIEEYKEALDLAFSHDETILIEEFEEGKEYRIFVMGDEVVAAMHRVPANVTGNGKNTIKDLVHRKNKDSLRGTGYRKPLQKINLGKEEKMFLAQSNRDFDSIPLDGEVVYLRENSNISTGGDSIDITDEISDAYKKIAVRSAKALGAHITGVDLITTDIMDENASNYSVIELNFNPAIHIHCYPYKGKNRQLGNKIIEHLKLS